MKTRIILPAALLLALCAGFPAGAQESPRTEATETAVPASPVERLGAVAFRVPAGWERQAVRNVLVLKPAKTPEKGSFVVLVYTGLDFTGDDFAAWSKEQARERVRKDTVEGEKPPLLTRDPETGDETVLLALRVKDTKGRHWTSLFQAGHSGTRAYLAMALTDQPELLQTYRADYLRLMSSLYILQDRPAAR